MVNFVLDMTVSGSASPTPSIPTVASREGEFMLEANKILEINLTETQARIFQFKTVSDTPNWTDATENEFKYRYKPATTHTATDRTKNWPVFLNHWHNWTDQHNAKLSTSTSTRLDQALGNRLAYKVFGAPVAAEIFNNERVVLNTIGMGINEGLKQIRTKFQTAYVALGLQDGSGQNASDTILSADFQDNITDNPDYDNNIPEYLLHRILKDEASRVTTTNLSNPSDLSANYGAISCFTVANTYSDWIDVPICAGDSILMKINITVNAVNPLNPNDTVTVSTQMKDDGDAHPYIEPTTADASSNTAVLKINVVKNDTTDNLGFNIQDFDDKDNANDFNGNTNGDKYFRDGDSSFVGPYSSTPEDPTGGSNKMVFRTTRASEQYTDTDKTNDGTTASQTQVTITGRTYYQPHNHTKYSTSENLDNQGALDEENPSVQTTAFTFTGLGVNTTTTNTLLNSDNMSVNYSITFSEPLASNSVMSDIIRYSGGGKLVDDLGNGATVTGTSTDDITWTGTITTGSGVVMTNKTIELVGYTDVAGNTGDTVTTDATITIDTLNPSFDVASFKIVDANGHDLEHNGSSRLFNEDDKATSKLQYKISGANGREISITLRDADAGANISTVTFTNTSTNTVVTINNFIGAGSSYFNTSTITLTDNTNYQLNASVTDEPGGNEATGLFAFKTDFSDPSITTNTFSSILNTYEKDGISTSYLNSANAASYSFEIATSDTDFPTNNYGRIQINSVDRVQSTVVHGTGTTYYSFGGSNYKDITMIANSVTITESTTDFDLNTLANGNYDFDVLLTDSAGNIDKGTLAKVAFTVDKTAPAHSSVALSTTLNVVHVTFDKLLSTTDGNTTTASNWTIVGTNNYTVSSVEQVDDSVTVLKLTLNKNVTSDIKVQYTKDGLNDIVDYAENPLETFTSDFVVVDAFDDSTIALNDNTNILTLTTQNSHQIQLDSSIDTAALSDFTAIDDLKFRYTLSVDTNTTILGDVSSVKLAADRGSIEMQLPSTVSGPGANDITIDSIELNYDITDAATDLNTLPDIGNGSNGSYSGEPAIFGASASDHIIVDSTLKKGNSFSLALNNSDANNPRVLFINKTNIKAVSFWIYLHTDQTNQNFLIESKPLQFGFNSVDTTNGSIFYKYGLYGGGDFELYINGNLATQSDAHNWNNDPIPGNTWTHIHVQWNTNTNNPVTIFHETDINTYRSMGMRGGNIAKLYLFNSKITTEEITQLAAGKSVSSGGGGSSLYDTTSENLHKIELDLNNNFGETFTAASQLSKSGGDGDGNQIIDEIDFTVVDSTAPEVAITASVADSATTNDSSITMTFTVTEVNGHDFNVNDITATNGTISAFTDTGNNVYTATLTSDDATASAQTNTVVISAGAFKDDTDNVNTESNTFTWTCDQVKPTVAISHASESSGATTNGDSGSGTISLTVTVSKDHNNLADSNFTLNNCTIALTNNNNNNTYTVVVTPNGDATDGSKTCSISIAADEFTDTVGNNNTVSNTFTWTCDQSNPTMTIEDNNGVITSGATTNDSDITLKFTTNETTNFGESDITPTHCTLSEFTTNGNVHTVKVTPSGTPTNAPVTCTVDIPIGAFQDEPATNSNSVAYSFVWICDKVQPEITTVDDAGTGTTYYKEGDVIDIKVTFDDTVIVTGTPKITLNNGGEATYDSGSDSTVLTFRYTVGANNSEDNAGLNYTNSESLSFNSGTIKDSLGNDAIISLPAKATSGLIVGGRTIIIDNTHPVPSTQTRVGTNVSGTYYVKSGETPSYVFQSDSAGSIVSINNAYGVMADLSNATGYSISANESYTVNLYKSNAEDTLDDGVHNSIQIVVNDLAGNETTLDVDDFTVDKTAPTVTTQTRVGTNVSGTYYVKSGETPTYAFQSDSAGSIVSISEKYAVISGGATTIVDYTIAADQTYTIEIKNAADAILVDGTYNLSIVVKDVAGNTTTHSIPAFTVDKTIPVIDSIVPSWNASYNYGIKSGLNASGTTITINTSNASDGDVVTLTLSGESVTNDVTGTIASNAVTISENVTAFINDISNNDGNTYKIIANITDAAGNVGTEKERSISVDVTSLTITEVTAIANTNGNPTYTFNINENGTLSVNINGTASTDYTVTGLNTDNNLTTGGNIILTFTNIAEGTYDAGHIVISVTDSVGNVTQKSLSGFKKVTTIPSITSAVGNWGDYLNNTEKDSAQITVTVTTSEDIGGTVTIGNIAGNGNYSGNIAAGAGAKTATIDITAGDLDGIDNNTSKTLAVNFTDDVGNAAVASSITFTVDTVNPSVSFNSIDWGTKRGDSSTIVMIPSDQSVTTDNITFNISGAKKITAWIDGKDQIQDSWNKDNINANDVTAFITMDDELNDVNAAGSFKFYAEDAAGNQSSTQTQAFEFDAGKAQIVSLVTDNASLNTIDISATITATFDQPIAELPSDTFTVTNGTLGAFTSTDDIVWTATFTASDNIDANADITTDTSKSITKYIRINSGVKEGNSQNITTQSVSIAVDTLIPTASTPATNGDGDIEITFNDNVSGAVVSNFILSNSGALTSVNTSDAKVTLILTEKIVKGVSDLTIDYSGTEIIDDASNKVVNFTNQAIVTTAGVLTLNSAVANGDGNIELTFAENITTHNASGVGITVANNTVSSVELSNGKVIVNLATKLVKGGTSETITYNETNIADASSNKAQVFADQAINTTAGLLTLNSVTVDEWVNGAVYIYLDFNENIHNHPYLMSDFAVINDGSSVPLNDIGVNNGNITIVLDAMINISNTSNITVQYTQNNTDSTKHLRDSVGNKVATFGPHGMPPIVDTVNETPSISDNVITIPFTQDITAVSINADDFGVTDANDNVLTTDGGSVNVTITSVIIESGQVKITLSHIPDNASGKVTYTKHATTNRNIKNSAGYPVLGFTTTF